MKKASEYLKRIEAACSPYWDNELKEYQKAAIMAEKMKKGLEVDCHFSAVHHLAWRIFCELGGPQTHVREDHKGGEERTRGNYIAFMDKNFTFMTIRTKK